MATLTFEIYEKNNDNAVLTETKQFDNEADDVATQLSVTEEVRELSKKKECSPCSEL